jgi:hypothetical protein
VRVRCHTAQSAPSTNSSSRSSSCGTMLTGENAWPPSDVQELQSSPSPVMWYTFASSPTWKTSIRSARQATARGWEMTVPGNLLRSPQRLSQVWW